MIVDVRNFSTFIAWSTVNLVFCASLSMADVKTSLPEEYDSALGKPKGESSSNARGMRLRSQPDFGEYWNHRKYLDSGDVDSRGSENLRGDLLEPLPDMNPLGKEVLIVVCCLIFFGLQLRREPGTAAGSKLDRS